MNPEDLAVCLPWEQYVGLSRWPALVVETDADVNGIDNGAEPLKVKQKKIIKKCCR